MHARKAWLKGLSPKENREVPPLDYELVYRLKRELPELTIVINGGIATLDEVREHLRHVDGVMLGRAAYHEPYRLAEVEHALFGTPLPDRDDVLERMRRTSKRIWRAAIACSTSRRQSSVCTRVCRAHARSGAC